jgi:hypothetical protein
MLPEQSSLLYVTRHEYAPLATPTTQTSINATTFDGITNVCAFISTGYRVEHSDNGE